MKHFYLTKHEFKKFRLHIFLNYYLFVLGVLLDTKVADFHVIGPATLVFTDWKTPCEKGVGLLTHPYKMYTINFIDQTF